MKLLYSSYIKDPKNVCFDGEDPDETVLLVLRKHFVTNIPWFLLFVFLLNLPDLLYLLIKFNGFDSWELIPLSYRFVLSTFWFVFTFGFFFVSFLTWYFTVNIVSSRRVVDIDFIGFINRRFSEALLTNIQDLTNEVSGAVQIVFHYGTLLIQTAGEKQEIEFDDIPDPAGAQDFISDLTRGVKADGKSDLKEPK
jgi:uncharacterized membrane protein YdbT with pleckstrin-like domain